MSWRPSSGQMSAYPSSGLDAVGPGAGGIMGPQVNQANLQAPGYARTAAQADPYAQAISQYGRIPQQQAPSRYQQFYSPRNLGFMGGSMYGQQPMSSPYMQQYNPYQSMMMPQQRMLNQYLYGRQQSYNPMQRYQQRYNPVQAGQQPQLPDPAGIGGIDNMVPRQEGIESWQQKAPTEMQGAMQGYPSKVQQERISQNSYREPGFYGPEDMGGFIGLLGRGGY